MSDDYYSEKYPVIHPHVVYRIEYTDFTGKTRKEEGTIKSLNADGFVILNQGDGHRVLIPRDRVVRIESRGSTL